MFLLPNLGMLFSDYFSDVYVHLSLCISYHYRVNSFPKTAVVKYHKVGGLKQQKCIVSQV